MTKKLFTIFLMLVIFLAPITTLAHSGGTDGAGGHYNHSTGEYHYHHGYPEHEHYNDKCPYIDKDIDIEKEKKKETRAKTFSTIFAIIFVGTFTVPVFPAIIKSIIDKCKEWFQKKR